MANRRMFSLDVVSSDYFLDMPPSAQNLYFHFAMRADDDGFVKNPHAIMRMVSAAKEDMPLLSKAGLIIIFKSGVIAIRHWRMHNSIQKDRYKRTVYTDELNGLEVTENGVYIEKSRKYGGSGIENRIESESKIESGSRFEEEQSAAEKDDSSPAPAADTTAAIPPSGTSDITSDTDVYSMDTECIQSCPDLYTQDRIGKDRIGYIPHTSPKGDRCEKAADNEERFKSFWKEYPRKQSIGKAEKLWNKLKPDKEMYESIMKALREQKELPQWNNENGRYIPSPCSWLSGRCWEDKPTLPAAVRYENEHSYELEEYKRLVNRF